MRIDPRGQQLQGYYERDSRESAEDHEQIPQFGIPRPVENE